MEDIHVISPVSLCLVFIIITFLEDNPLIILCIFAFILIVFIKRGAVKKLKAGLIYFIPFAIMNMAINMFFVSKGSFVVFSAFGRDFTLESIIYAFSLTFKLLVVIYIFMMLGLLVDSDSAVSYFMSKVPKTSLAMMIGIKFFPIMKERVKSIKMVYSARGVDFERGNIKHRIKSNLEVLSVLLEDSLETFFNIAEAAYVRGFLSGKRTTYDKQKFHKRDYFFTIVYFSYFLAFLILHIFKFDSFDIYAYGITRNSFLNLSVYIFFIVTIFNSLIINKGLSVERGEV